MSQTAQDNQPAGIRRSMLPSSLVSVGLHVLLLIAASSTLRGCEKGVPAEAGGEQFRDIGLKLVADTTESDTDLPGSETDDQSEGPAQPESRAAEAVPEEAPSVDELLSQNDAQASMEASDPLDDLPPIIGAGTPVGDVTGGGIVAPELIRSSGTAGQSSSGSPTPGPNHASFMQIADSGRSFVYLIDTSSSMGEGRRLSFAKQQLKASLRQLKPYQQFQVIFYNDDEFPSRINLRRGPAQNLYPATVIHVQLACNAIDSRHPDGGTEHLPALLDALSLNADVIYFLTDGREPQLTDRELKKLRGQNRSGTHIHVVEFGIGLQETRDVSWLHQLAAQSGGEYRYWGGD
jgi:hypothetical protein